MLSKGERVQLVINGTGYETGTVVRYMRSGAGDEVFVRLPDGSETAWPAAYAVRVR